MNLKTMALRGEKDRYQSLSPLCAPRLSGVKNCPIDHLVLEEGCSRYMAILQLLGSERATQLAQKHRLTVRWRTEIFKGVDSDAPIDRREAFEAEVSQVFNLSVNQVFVGA